MFISPMRTFLCSILFAFSVHTNANFVVAKVDGTDGKFACSNDFLLLDGVGPELRDQFEVLGLDFGLSTAIAPSDGRSRSAGKTSPDVIGIRKKFDACSPRFMQALVVGETLFVEISIYGVPRSEDNFTEFSVPAVLTKITFRGLVQSVQSAAESGSNLGGNPFDLTQEVITFVPENLKIENTKSTTFEFNFVTNESDF